MSEYILDKDMLKVFFNGSDLEKIYSNGTLVWEKPGAVDPNPPSLTPFWYNPGIYDGYTSGEITRATNNSYSDHIREFFGDSNRRNFILKDLAYNRLFSFDGYNDIYSEWCDWSYDEDTHTVTFSIFEEKQFWNGNNITADIIVNNILFACLPGSSGFAGPLLRFAYGLGIDNGFYFDSQVGLDEYYNFLRSHIYSINDRDFCMVLEPMNSALNPISIDCILLALTELPILEFNANPCEAGIENLNSYLECVNSIDYEGSFKIGAYLNWPQYLTNDSQYFYFNESYGADTYQTEPFFKNTSLDNSGYDITDYYSSFISEWTCYMPAARTMQYTNNQKLLLQSLKCWLFLHFVQMCGAEGGHYSLDTRRMKVGNTALSDNTYIELDSEVYPTELGARFNCSFDWDFDNGLTYDIGDLSEDEFAQILSELGITTIAFVCRPNDYISFDSDADTAEEPEIFEHIKNSFPSGIQHYITILYPSEICPGFYDQTYGRIEELDNYFKDGQDSFLYNDILYCGINHLSYDSTGIYYYYENHTGNSYFKYDPYESYFENTSMRQAVMDFRELYNSDVDWNYSCNLFPFYQSFSHIPLGPGSIITARTDNDINGGYNETSYWGKAFNLGDLGDSVCLKIPGYNI